MKISDRLTQLKDKLGLSQAQVSSKFGIPLGTWRQYERGPSEPGAGALRNLADGGVNIHWLLTGEGEMLLEDAARVPDDVQASIDMALAYAGDKEAAQRTQSRSQVVMDKFNAAWRQLQEIIDTEGYRPPRMTLENFKSLLWHFPDYGPVVQAAVKELAEQAEQLALVPFYDIEASAGHGFLVDQELQTSQMAFRKDWLKQKGLQASKCALIKAKGDSMEPTIHDGDLLLVDTSIDHIKDDSIYIVQTDSHLIVKRLQQNLDGSLTIISDNRMYNQQVLGAEQAKEIKIAGRVRWYGHEI